MKKAKMPERAERHTGARRGACGEKLRAKRMPQLGRERKDAGGRKSPRPCRGRGGTVTFAAFMVGPSSYRTSRPEKNDRLPRLLEVPEKTRRFRHMPEVRPGTLTQRCRENVRQNVNTHPPGYISSHVAANKLLLVGFRHICGECNGCNQLCGKIRRGIL